MGAIINYFNNAKRIVIKIGSSLLVDNNKVSLLWLNSLASDIKSLKDQGMEIVIVSSGAIALGRGILEIAHSNSNSLADSQAAAAVGQISLAHAYETALREHDINIAQILLTPGDTEGRRSYLNARNTLEKLISLDVIAVVNENDTVATSEIRYGDNDRLAALVSGMISADCLVLLSDVKGLYSNSPALDPSAKLIREVKDITPEIEKMAGKAGSRFGTGGMITKLAAAKIAMASGANMVITNGRVSNPLLRLCKGEECTWFVASETPINARKKWLTANLQPKGFLTVDDGAITALKNGSSLLPAGIKEISGSFFRGDLVVVTNLSGVEVARGLVTYDHNEVRQIIGYKTAEISNILGYVRQNEIIHRDNMVLNSHL